MENPPKKMKYEWPIDLPNRLNFLLKSGQFSDCSFAVGTEPDVKVFKAHKLLLSAASPVFRAMFYGKLVDDGPIKIVDIRPDIFQTMLNFIYTDQVLLETFEQARDVWYAADKYIIPKLFGDCERRILAILNVSNACQAYEVAKCFDRVDLMHRILRIIMESTSQVLKSPSFENIKLSTLLMILDTDKLKLATDRNYQNDPTDYILLEAVVRWGIAKCKRNETAEDMINVRKAIEPALRKIRFLNFSADEFKIVTEKWKILTDDEESVILDIISKKPALPLMPEGFSASRVPRKYDVHS